ncbi:unnamed protein product, partial [Heligmosomoides polygyrus]|uniref:Uncharacterized protein n=1 Tax=Heligmosomoides polygyrus TaxID=6339 RepID=A0A183FBG1_HELPZ
SLETTASHTSQQQILTAPQSPVQAQLSLNPTIPAPTAIPPPQLPYCTTIQLSKYKLKPFDGDITQFQRFWGAFQLAVHNNPNIPPLEKYLHLQSLLTGDALMVLDDVDPADNNYFELVRALKRRYDCPHTTRAALHVQLQQLPQAGNTGPELRRTWSRLTAILHGLRRHEDFRTVLPLLDLVKSKFPDTIREKLHELEYQSNSQFDLDQIMRKLDHIIISKERYENSTTLGRHFATLRINFDVTSCVCAIFAGSAYVMVIPLVLVRTALVLFAEGTTIVSSAGEQSVETDPTVLPPKNDAAEVKNDAVATAIGIDRRQGTRREVHHATIVIHDVTAQAVQVQLDV